MYVRATQKKLKEQKLAVYQTARLQASKAHRRQHRDWVANDRVSFTDSEADVTPSFTDFACAQISRKWRRTSTRTASTAHATPLQRSNKRSSPDNDTNYRHLVMNRYGRVTWPISAHVIGRHGGSQRTLPREWADVSKDDCGWKSFYSRRSGWNWRRVDQTAMFLGNSPLHVQNRSLASSFQEHTSYIVQWKPSRFSIVTGLKIDFKSDWLGTNVT